MDSTVEQEDAAPHRTLPPTKRSEGNERLSTTKPTGRFDTAQVNYDSAGAPATATLLIKHALLSPEDEGWRLAGEPFALYSALERTGDRATRISMVRAYWRLTAEVASYNWAVEEGAFIAGLEASARGADQFVLNAARLDAQVHLQAAKLNATSAQYELAELARLSPSDLPPVPADSPLVTPYQTKFERIFANRTPPAGLRRVAQLIPLQFALLETQAAAVAADTDAIKQLQHEHQQGQVALESVVHAHERLYRHRREFLQSVRAYNELIADYALAIGSSTNNETLVSMLIRNPVTPRVAQAPRRFAVDRVEATESSERGRVAVPVAPAVPMNSDRMAPSSRQGFERSTSPPPPSRSSGGSGTWMAPRANVPNGLRSSFNDQTSVDQPEIVERSPSGGGTFGGQRFANPPVEVTTDPRSDSGYVDPTGAGGPPPREPSADDQGRMARPPTSRFEGAPVNAVQPATELPETGNQFEGTPIEGMPIGEGDRGTLPENGAQEGRPPEDGPPEDGPPADGPQVDEPQGGGESTEGEPVDSPAPQGADARPSLGSPFRPR